MKKITKIYIEKPFYTENDHHISHFIKNSECSTWNIYYMDKEFDLVVVFSLTQMMRECFIVLFSQLFHVEQ